MRRDAPVRIPFNRPATTVTRRRPRTPAGVEPIVYPAAVSPELIRQVRAELDSVPLADFRRMETPAAVAPAALRGLLAQAASDFGVETVFWLAGIKRFAPGAAIDWHRDEITLPGWQIRPHHSSPTAGTADVSFNVCLAGPDEYVGADFETRDGRTLRLNAGDCVGFPGDLEHRVTRMTSGRRYTAVFVGIDYRRLPLGGYRPSNSLEVSR